MLARMSNYPLRLNPDLKARAETRAQALGISLNALIAVALDSYLGQPPCPRSASRPAARSPATVRQTPTPARNAPCSCGSGQKYKRCCGAPG